MKRWSGGGSVSLLRSALGLLLEARPVLVSPSISQLVLDPSQRPLSLLLRRQRILPALLARLLLASAPTLPRPDAPQAPGRVGGSVRSPVART